MPLVTTTRPATTCDVAILPTLHQLHKDPAFAHYDYDVLRQLILAFHPDCVCGEIRPADWVKTDGGRRPGYCGPVEYRECILPLCRERGIPFHPVDEYPDEIAREMGSAASGEKAGAESGDPGDSGTAQQARPLQVEERAWSLVVEAFTALLQRAELGVGALLDGAILDVIRAKHRLQQVSDPREEALTWSPRNLRMAANILDVCAGYLGGRVLVTVGLEHVPFLTDHLSLCPAIRLVPPVPEAGAPGWTAAGR